MNEKRFFRKERFLSQLCLAVNLIAYVGFAILDGPVWCRDSNSYATMDYTREPIYCTFLWLMRRLFGESVMVHGWDLTDREGGKAAAWEPLYLMAVIICQAALMAITVWYLAKVVYGIGKRLQVRKAAAGFAAAANLIMWGVDGLNRFGAKRGSAYFQSIMTEGFGISFYILFLLFLFQYLHSRREAMHRLPVSAAAGQTSCGSTSRRDESGAGGKENAHWKRYLALAVLMMAVCASHHKQLTITILIYAAACGLSDIVMLVKEKRGCRNSEKIGNERAEQKHEPHVTAGQNHCEENKSGGSAARHWILRDIIALAAAGIVIFLAGHIYNLTFHGVWSFHTGSADKVDSTLLYTVTADDAELFDRYGDVQEGEDADDLKNLFLQIEQQMTEQQLRYVDVMHETQSVTQIQEEGTEAAQDGTQSGIDAENGTQEDTAADEPQEENGSNELADYGEKVTWVELCSHYSDCYDIIGFQVLDPLVDTYVREHHPELEPGTMAFAIETDAVCQRLEKVLLHQNLGRLLYLWINNVRKGFVNTVLRVSTVLNWASLVLWILYGVLFAAGIRRIAGIRKRKSDASRNAMPQPLSESTSKGNGAIDAVKANIQGGEKNAALYDILLLAGLVFLGTLINCMVVGAIIFPQTRYMIYNMGLFYVCLGMMGVAGWMKET